MDELVCVKCGISRKLDRFAIRSDFKLRRRRICKDCKNEQTRNKWRDVRKRVFDQYGWKCVCCGEEIKEFLSLDHIHNDGYLDKNPNGDKKSGKELYLLVIKQNFPDKYQTLCMNCNWGKKVRNGKCPHESI